MGTPSPNNRPTLENWMEIFAPHDLPLPNQLLPFHVNIRHLKAIIVGSNADIDKLIVEAMMVILMVF